MSSSPISKFSTGSGSDSSTAKYTPPPSPSTTPSYYDMSDNDDDGEGNGYGTITHSASGREVKLLFSKSKVYVHPTSSTKDNISGFIALCQQKTTAPVPGQKPPGGGRAEGGGRGEEEEEGSSSSRLSSEDKKKEIAKNLLLAWVPESVLGDAYDIYVKVDLIDADAPPKQSYLVPPLPTTAPPGHSSTGTSAALGSSTVGCYAFAVPVSDIYSIFVRPPSIGWWWGSLVINTRFGDSFPALFFHDSECASTIAQSKRRTRINFDPFGESGEMFWGGDEVLRWLRRFVRVERSELEPSVYLVDPGSEVEPSVYLVNPSPEDLISFVSKRASAANRATGAGAAQFEGAGPSMDPFTRAIKEAKWSFLEKLTRVTRFTRNTVEDILDNPRVPPPVRRLLKNPDVVSLQDEFDSARLYLARWAMGIAEQSERDKVRAGEVIDLEDSAVGEFEILDIEAGNLKVDSDRRRAVTLEEWNKWFDAHSGVLQISVNEVKERIFHGGIDPAARKEVWLFLLDVYPWDSSRDERRAIMASKRDEYVRLKRSWWDNMDGRSGDDYWREQKNRIEKDVHRTDRTVPMFAGEDIPHPEPDSPFSEVGTNVHMEQMKEMLLTYNEFNKNLGYVQGMSDLLAPLYAVLQDDALAFWAFIGFMNRMERNFLRDQSGMRAQLVTLDHLVQLMDPKLYRHLQAADSTNFFFFFRMLLVWYKREFGWDDVLTLWERLWTNYLSGQFHLFVALAVLERHRHVIMEHLKQFDEVLKYINELSNTIDLQSTLIRAEALYYRFQRTVDLADKKAEQESNAGSMIAGELRRRLGLQSTALSQSGEEGGDNTAVAAPAVEASGSAAPPSATRKDRGKAPVKSSDREQQEEGSKRVPVISPELRMLLSKENIVVKEEVRKHPVNDRARGG